MNPEPAMDETKFPTAARLGAAAVHMAGLANQIEAQVAEIKRMNIEDVLRFWHFNGDAYEAMDKERKRLYAALETLSRVSIPEIMGEKKVRTVTLDDVGFRFTVSQRFSASMPDKERGKEWLRSNGLGDIIQETINAQTLSSAIKKMIEDDGKDPPAELFTTNYMSYTSATKAR